MAECKVKITVIKKMNMHELYGDKPGGITP